MRVFSFSIFMVIMMTIEKCSFHLSLVFYYSDWNSGYCLSSLLILQVSILILIINKYTYSSYLLIIYYYNKFYIHMAQ